ncbi:MAG: fibrobacter succinogenes major paralogous domain-containing protein [Candidatus Azobacteroides sp.]|nr:fibrobacter succinogenes major paralogous domain-containing protein [Candidatus Azobacteroides sp.]
MSCNFKIKVKFIGFLLLLAVLGMVGVAFNSCKSTNTGYKRLTYDEGVVINGIKWATRNVDEFGTFAQTPESAGKFYQWNRKKAWNVIGNVIDWDTTISESDIWEKSNDPSPVGWHVPTIKEIETLFDDDKVSNERTTKNGINGRKFTDKATGNSIFLPAVGGRNGSDSKLFYDGNTGWYWSSSPSNIHGAHGLGFGSDKAYWGGSSRSHGFSVRPVAD